MALESELDPNVFGQFMHKKLLEPGCSSDPLPPSHSPAPTSSAPARFWRSLYHKLVDEEQDQFDSFCRWLRGSRGIQTDESLCDADGVPLILVDEESFLRVSLMVFPSWSCGKILDLFDILDLDDLGFVNIEHFYLILCGQVAKMGGTLSHFLHKYGQTLFDMLLLLSIRYHSMDFSVQGVTFHAIRQLCFMLTLDECTVVRLLRQMQVQGNESLSEISQDGPELHRGFRDFAPKHLNSLLVQLEFDECMLTLFNIFDVWDSRVNPFDIEAKTVERPPEIQAHNEKNEGKANSMIPEQVQTATTRAAAVPSPVKSNNNNSTTTTTTNNNNNNNNGSGVSKPGLTATTPAAEQSRKVGRTSMTTTRRTSTVRVAPNSQRGDIPQLQLSKVNVNSTNLGSRKSVREIVNFFEKLN